MDIKDIKQIVDLVKRSELTEFEIEEENFRLRIARNPCNGMHPGAIPAAAAPAAAPVAAAPAEAPVVDDKSVAFIKSPMVGTFYRSPNPESPSFVDEGTAVTTETVVCIIEAMKVMNEIQAEVKGKIVECLVENGNPVEYGQPLFKVKTS